MKKKEDIQEKQKQVENNIREKAKMEVEDLYSALKSSDEGVSVVNIEDLQEEYGKNAIEVDSTHSLM